MEVDEGMAKRDAWVNRIEAATKSSVRASKPSMDGGQKPKKPTSDHHNLGGS
jgi:hypothetical protein